MLKIMLKIMCLQVRRDGGLFVIGTYLFESQRVENQLMGRAGRQVNQQSLFLIVETVDVSVAAHGESARRP